MSELIKIDDRINILKADAEAAALARRSVDDCEYKDNPRLHDLWKTFYYIAWENDYLARAAA